MDAESLMMKHCFSIALALVCLVGAGCGEDTAAVEDQDTGVRVEQPAPDAGQQTCNGCVDSAGQCQSGDDDEACGASGAACAVCDDGNTCTDGACVETPTCGPQTCDGCCDEAGECATGGDDDTSGLGGASCVT